MLPRSPDLFTVSNLKDLDPAKFNWFSENGADPTALAGRCLLDTMEYLRAIPGFSAQFREIINAHAMRLICRYLSDDAMGAANALGQMKTHILDACRQLRGKRKDDAPCYGDDFWDWAAVLEALVAVNTNFPDAQNPSDAELNQELRSFYDNVVQRVTSGLTIASNEDKEWYGPATAAAAYRLISKHKDRFDNEVDGVLAKLKEQALEPIVNGQYCGRVIVPYQQLWHYGQVVAEFSDDTKLQAKRIADLSCLASTPDKADRVYALARVIQAADKIDDRETFGKALEALYKCEDQGRPLGQGLLGDNVKGSLNVLEALWPTVKPDRKPRVHEMVEALSRAKHLANTIGIVVAIDYENASLKKAFEQTGARLVMEDEAGAVFEHGSYRVVICAGKSVMGAPDAARTLIDKHRVKWLIMLGVAGSLGKFTRSFWKRRHVSGPDLGDVVIATSLAPYLIYYKIREQIENAGVPFRGQVWNSIPTDPRLFGLAHEAAEDLFGKPKRFHEGLIVSGTAVVDLLQAKTDVLKTFPGGLAVETEGFAVGLVCLLSNVPFLVVRGLSDPADGGKKDQAADAAREKKEQSSAALAAGQLVVRVVELIGQRW